MRRQRDGARSFDEIEHLYGELASLLDGPRTDVNGARIEAVQARLAQLEDTEAGILAEILKSRLAVPIAELTAARAEYDRLTSHGRTTTGGKR